MQKKQFLTVAFTIFTLLLLGIGSGYYGGDAQAQDYYTLTVTFGWPAVSKDIQVLIDVYEYIPGMTALGPSVVRLMTNTNSNLNLPSAGPLQIPLPLGMKFLIKATPMAGRPNTETPYQIKEANYQSQFYSKNRTPAKAVEHNDIIDTSSGTSRSISFSLEPGFKIQGSVRACESSSNYIEGVTIKVFDEQQVFVTQFGRSTNTGGYTIYGLSPGKYYLMADGSSKGYVRSFYKGETGADLIGDAELIEITTSDLTRKNFCLKEGYSVKGSLLDPDGAPMGRGTTVYLLDAFSSAPVGWYFYDPNSSGVYDEFMAQRNYILSSGVLDFAYSGNTPEYFIGGLDPNYSVGGAPRGTGGSFILLGVAPTGAYAPAVYKDHYSIDKADLIPLADIAQGSNFDLQFRRAGKIQGSVKDKDGKPLGNIAVKAIDASDETRVILPVRTDPNTGDYILAGLPPMDYKVQVVDELNRKYLWQYYPGKSSFAQARTISVTDQNLNTSDIDFVLEIGGKITGCVLDATSHEPVVGAAIQAFRIGSGSTLVNYPVTTIPSGAALTGENGNYVISGLPMGQYIIYAGPPIGRNYVPVFYQDSDTVNGADPNMVIDHPNQLIFDVDFSLKRGGIVEGRITGIPAEVKSSLIRNMHVDLTEAETGKLMQATTELIDPNTLEYKIVGIPGGKYKIGIKDTRMPPEMIKKYYNKESGTAGVSSYKEASTFEIDLVTDPNKKIDFYWDSVGKSIKGKVLDQVQKPLSNIRIDAYQVEASSGKVLDIGIYNYTNTAGEYYLKGLAGGTYVLKASDDMNLIYPAQFYNPDNNSYRLDTATRITVPASSPDASFDFKLNKQIGIISGTVTKGTEKEPCPGSWVYFYLNEDDKSLRGVRADSDGKYQFTALPEGAYKIRAFDPDKVYVPRFYTSSSSVYAFNRAEGETVTVDYTAPLSSTHKDICLDEQGAQIRGEVKSSENNSSLADIFIYLYQFDNNQWSFVADYYTVITDTDGKYTIKGLAEGTYKVLAWEHKNSYVPTEHELTLTQGEQSVVNFSLPKAATGSKTKYTLNLSQGMNLFCFPTKVPLWPALYNVNNLMTEWATATASGITNLLHFDTEKGKWENQLSAFLIENGKGYVIYSTTNEKISYYGDLFAGQDGNVMIDLQAGMNIVGNIRSVGVADYDSYKMINNLSNRVYGVRDYDSTTGKWLNSTRLWGKSGGDKFSIYPTRGYIVDMKESHISWLP